MFKRAVFIILFLIVEQATFAQTVMVKGTPKLTAGFNLGINRTSLQYESNNTVSEEEKVGYRLGILAEYMISDRLFVSPKGELSFYNNSLIVNEDKNSEYEIMPASLEFMAHMGYKFGQSNLKPYLFIGPNFKLPLEVEEDQTNQFKTNSDLAIDFGIGLERDFIHFFFSPELRYSYGLMDVNKNPAFQNIYIHNIALVINFKG